MAPHNGSVPQIPGVKAESELAHSFRREVATLLGRKSLGFPGAQPVSFARRHLAELQCQDYYVCEKSDGIRCLMYFAAEGGREIHYLIDRKNEYYYVADLHFPVPHDDTYQNFHIDTVIDGELVNDRQADGSLQLRYLVFDCLMLDGNSLMQRTLDKRLAYFRDKVYNPYKALYARFPEELAYLPFIVEFKRMEFSYGIEMMFRDILPNLPHGNDGLIFTARNTPYRFGTDDHILKWKPETENSVDFRLTLDFPLREPDEIDEADGITDPWPDWDAHPTFVLSVSYGDGVYRPYATMHVTTPEWEDLKALDKPLQETIVECVQDDRRRWRFLRFRDDKRDANHISTVESVLESIEDRVGQRDLLGAAKGIRDAWKRRQREEEERGRKEADERRRAIEEERRKGRGEERGRRDGEHSWGGEEELGSNGNGGGNGVERKTMPE
ncbi:MAG: Dcp1p-Dcp2p decapping enzyme complex alpha subunit [Peltula sp. TS41687]|nr:MAG: Dcp1p-Dcp2p decapping enzyme complex alpha subunit [Peltula sp. TS41687]